MLCDVYEVVFILDIGMVLVDIGIVGNNRSDVVLLDNISVRVGILLDNCILDDKCEDDKSLSSMSEDVYDMSDISELVLGDDNWDVLCGADQVVFEVEGILLISFAEAA